jgi:hypothetical protein
MRTMSSLKRRSKIEGRQREIAGPAVVALVATCVLACKPAFADSPVELGLCPATIVHTCFVGYVTSANGVVLLLSSMDNDPMVGKRVEVLETPPGAAVGRLDLSQDVGSIVMLDATEDGGLYSARLVSVADPLLTALYMSVFLQSTTAGAPH